MKHYILYILVSIICTGVFLVVIHFFMSTKYKFIFKDLSVTLNICRKSFWFPFLDVYQNIDFPTIPSVLVSIDRSDPIGTIYSLLKRLRKRKLFDIWENFYDTYKIFLVYNNFVRREIFIGESYSEDILKKLGSIFKIAIFNKDESKINIILSSLFFRLLLIILSGMIIGVVFELCEKYSYIYVFFAFGPTLVLCLLSYIMNIYDNNMNDKFIYK